jgi:putative DNA methylase
MSTQAPNISAAQSVTPFSLQHAPALIEKLLPVQRLSIDVYKERMAGSGQTLTALGSYWKGRKPLVLNRACVLGALLPATDNPKADLEIFELLMAMDDTSLSKRAGLPKPKDIVAQLDIEDVWQWFTTSPEEARDGLPESAPFDLNDYEYENDKGKTTPIRLKWRDDITEDQKNQLAVRLLPQQPYRQTASSVLRAEEIAESVHTHIWPRVNAHLGTQASNFPELVEQLGIMRFGRRPKVADTFSGSGQIPFEAARLGCDVYASDLNPVACMLTWGAFNIVGASPEKRKQIEAEGVRNFQQTVAPAITDSYLQWRGIEATIELAKSNNSKVVVIGNSRTGLPLILDMQEGTQGAVSVGTGTPSSSTGD